MPLYRYETFDHAGKRVVGTLESSTSESAREALKGRKLLPISIDLVKGLEAGFFLFRLFEKKVEIKSIILFTKQLCVLLKAGVPLLDSIELLTEQFSGQLRRILINVKDGIKGGESFASTLENYPGVFSNIYIQLVRAGEATGKLDSVLERLTTYLEKGEETRKRIKKAMSYPIMILSFAVIVVMALILFVVPTIVTSFAQTGAELPMPTQILMTLSDFLSQYYLVAGGLFIGLIGAFSYARSTTAGRLALDKFNLRIPLISYFSRTRAVVQFSKTLGLLLDSGVHLSEALDIVSNIIDNMILTRAIKSARDKIIKEGKIAQYLKETNIFPPIAYYMIKTGEESGKLSEMLLYVGDEYDTQLTEIIDSLIAKINPIMMAVVGGIIFFIVLAMFLPMVRQGEALGL